MAIHGSLFEEFKETQAQDQFIRQSAKMLKVRMDYGPVMARLGSMVAYQGDIRFANKGSGGLNKMFKSAVTGEGVSMMECTGQGELFLADDASDVQILYLEDDMLSVNGANVLAFSSTIQWDIHRVSARGGMMAGGLFNVSLRGSGYVAVTTKGEPVALEVSSAPTFGDAQAVVLWTGGVRMDLRVDSGGIGSMLRGGTGEMIQMAFSGNGHVLVQPAENSRPTGAGEKRGGSGLGDLFGG